MISEVGSRLYLRQLTNGRDRIVLDNINLEASCEKNGIDIDQES